MPTHIKKGTCTDPFSAHLRSLAFIVSTCQVCIDSIERFAVSNRLLFFRNSRKMQECLHVRIWVHILEEKSLTIEKLRSEIAFCSMIAFYLCLCSWTFWVNFKTIKRMCTFEYIASFVLPKHLWHRKKSNSMVHKMKSTLLHFGSAACEFLIVGVKNVALENF